MVCHLQQATAALPIVLLVDCCRRMVYSAALPYSLCWSIVSLLLQDILTRYHRMRGEPTLFLPGQDHAGIATQMLVERALAAEGIDRKEIGREAFLKKVRRFSKEEFLFPQFRKFTSGVAGTNRQTNFLKQNGTKTIAGLCFYFFPAEFSCSFVVPVTGDHIK